MNNNEQKVVLIVEVLLPYNTYPGHVLFVEVPSATISTTHYSNTTHFNNDNNNKIVASKYIRLMNIEIMK